MSNNPQMSEYFTNSNTYNFLNFDTNESIINQVVHIILLLIRKCTQKHMHVFKPYQLHNRFWLRKK